MVIKNKEQHKILKETLKRRLINLVNLLNLKNPKNKEKNTDS